MSSNDNINRNGKLIVLEGPDGVGKTTIAKELAIHYQAMGIKSKSLAFPGNELGTLGHLVYQVHHHPENYNIEKLSAASLQLLHIAAHVDAIENQFRPLIDGGYYLILDRYWWSTWVYGLTSGADLDVIKAMIGVEKLSWAEIIPECVIILDRDQSLRPEGPDSQWQKLRTAYKQLLDEENGNYPISIVRNDGSVLDVTKKVISIIGEESTS